MGDNFRADGSQTGRLAASDSYDISGGAGNRSASVNYSDADGLGGFPTGLGDISATGSFSSRNVSNFSNFGRALYASVTNLNISLVTNFQPISISPVPEPAPWAMMLFGFGSVGFTMRRYRKVVVSLG